MPQKKKGKQPQPAKGTNDIRLNDYPKRGEKPSQLARRLAGLKERSRRAQMAILSEMVERNAVEPKIELDAEGSRKKWKQKVRKQFGEHAKWERKRKIIGRFLVENPQLIRGGNMEILALAAAKKGEMRELQRKIELHKAGRMIRSGRGGSIEGGIGILKSLLGEEAVAGFSKKYRSRTGEARKHHRAKRYREAAQWFERAGNIETALNLYSMAKDEKGIQRMIDEKEKRRNRRK